MNTVPFNTAIQRSAEGFNSEMIYDLNLIILAHYKGRYRERLEAMKRFGVLQTAGLHVHISLVCSPSDFEHLETLKKGWPNLTYVSVFEMSTHLVCPKINGYYLWLSDADLHARWHIRVDDDSITDVAYTIRQLELRYGESVVHLITDPVEPEAHPRHFTNYLKHNKISTPPIRAEWESSVTSGAAMHRILNDKHALRFLKDSGESIPEPSDRSLTIAAYIAGVAVGDNPLFTKAFQPTLLSILPGGTLSHIHGVPWSDVWFTRHLEAYLSRERKGINYEDTKVLTENNCSFGRCIGLHLAGLRLTSDGNISGNSSENETKWMFRDNTIIFINKKGHATSMFTTIIKNDAGIFFYGPFLRSSITHFIHFPF